MERTLNSIEELYQLISGTLLEGTVERIPSVNMDMLSCNGYYGNKHIANCYFVVTDSPYQDNVKIEHGGKFSYLVTTRIYKYA